MRTFRTRQPAVLEALDRRQLLTVTPLLSDAFSSPDSANINAGVTTAGRQSGLFSGSAWTEASATATGGSADSLTQVNHTVANSLLLATNAPAGRTGVFVATPAAMLEPRYGLSRVQVEITPQGVGSTGASTDHWAGLSIGGPAGASVNAAGVSGVLVRSSGAYQVWENGTKVNSGTLTGATTFAVDYLISANGAYTLSLNGTQVYVGTHGQAYGEGSITLINYSVGTSTGSQIDYYKNFAVTGDATVRSLLWDRFDTPSSTNINGTVTSTTRQSGLFSPLYFNEDESTLFGQSFDHLTQVGNGGSPNTLLIGADAANGHGSTYVAAPASVTQSKFGLSNVSVAIRPTSAGSTDHWAGMAVGGSVASSLTTSGSGVLVRVNGDYRVYDNGTSVASGNIAGATTFTVNYDIRPTGGYSVSINGASVYSGTHAGGFGSGVVSLQNYSASTSTGLQLDYFDDLKLSGYVNGAQANQTYYVSPTGSDANDGLSASRPWKTLARANKQTYGAGNQLLLQGGGAFTGNLTLYGPDSGSASSALTIGSYGNGRATLNAGGGDGITLRDTQYVNISDLTLTGSGYTTNTGSGINLFTERRKPVLKNYTLSGIDSSGFGRMGINLSVSTSDTTVTNSSVHDNGYGGLLMDQSRDNKGSRIFIDHVTATHNAGTTLIQSGFGILISNANNVIIQRSTALDNGWLPGQTGQVGGIQVIQCDRALIQYCESAFTHYGSADGDGIVIDSSTNSIMQYNYTHDNDGGGLWLGAESNATSANNIIRYNISQNDGRYNDGYGGIFFWTASTGQVNNTDVYGNTVYMSPNANGYGSSAVGFGFFAGTNLRVRNNLFAVTGNGTVNSRFIRYLSGGTGVLFQGNDYWSYNGSFSLIWRGTAFSSFAGWRAANAAPEQETLNGAAVYKNLNPQLASPGTAGTIGNADNLGTLSQYVIASTSPIKNVALDLNQFGTTWDPANFGADAFFTGRFSTTAKDFYGTALTTSGAGSWSIGASK